MEDKYYRDRTTLDQRKDLAEKVKMRYPGRLPIICEPHKRDDPSTAIDKNKFLCPSNLTMGQFVSVVRSRLKDVAPSEAIYLYIGEKAAIPSNTMTVEAAHEKYAEDDGLLYITFAKENTFG